MGVVEYQGIHRLVAERFSWIVAVWVHVLLFALLAGADLKEHPGTSVSAPIVVELLPLRDLARPALPEPVFQPETTREAGAEPVSLPDNEMPLSGTALPRPQAQWVQATSFYAGRVLSDRRSAQARLALATLVSGDRREQLCALEAMEQVRYAEPGFSPTRLAPHAFRNSIQRNNEIIAAAAAIRSGKIWYEIAYKCRMSASGSEIVGFEFALGDPIDRSLWDEHGLAPVY